MKLPRILSHDDDVICPNCTHQFCAIPINVQAELNGLRAELENERRKVTELVDGYEKDQAELKRLRTTIFTDNTQTVVNAEKYAQACQDEADELRAEVERLTLEKKAAAMNYEAVIEGLKAELFTSIGQEFDREPVAWVNYLEVMDDDLGFDDGFEIKSHAWKTKHAGKMIAMDLKIPLYLASGAAQKENT